LVNGKNSTEEKGVNTENNFFKDVLKDVVFKENEKMNLFDISRIEVGKKTAVIEEEEKEPLDLK